MTPDRIIQTVCDYYEVEPSQLKSRSRKRELVWPRHVSMYLIRKRLPKTSLMVTGDYFGRDHSTVIHACQTVQDITDTNEVLKSDLISIELSL